MQNTSRIDPSGLYRIKSIVRTKTGGPPLFDVSPSTWWLMVKQGRAPAPVRLGERMTCWRGSDLLAYAESLGGGQTA